MVSTYSMPVPAPAQDRISRDFIRKDARVPGVRRLTVCNSLRDLQGRNGRPMRAPQLLLRGAWLRRAGFHAGVPVKVHVSRGRLALVLTVPVVAGEVDPEWPKEPMTSERNDELLQSMLAGAARAYRYFTEDRIAYAMAGARPEPYERAAPKIGRNDPCPCGSGKKYKRCCGGAGAHDDGVH